MQLRLKYPPTPEAAPRHAALCVSAALLIHDIELDYSVESLELLEGLLDRLRQDGVAVEQVAEVLFACGCYVGEVFVRQAGANWCPTEGTSMEGVTGFPLLIQLGPQRYCNPVGKVFKRLVEGSDHGLASFYALFSRPEAPASDFLYDRH
jgi:hypothetical protein